MPTFEIPLLFGNNIRHMLPSGKIAQTDTNPEVFLYDFFIIYLLGEGSQ
jgi:hypothetical protein